MDPRVATDIFSRMSVVFRAAVRHYRIPPPICTIRASAAVAMVSSLVSGLTQQAAMGVTESAVSGLRTFIFPCLIEALHPMDERLTCEVVEELQQVSQNGRGTGVFVNAFKTATLSGLLEYGCAKWHDDRLPALPASIRNSPLGRALTEVRSHLGLRADGEQKRPSRTITPELQEFFVLEGDEPTMHRDWQEFLVRFRQSAKSVGFSHEKAQGIAAALGEMADNSALHAQSLAGALVGYQVVDGAAVCGVADVGMGVLASLRENETYRHLRTHVEALRTAIQDGATRYGRGKGGFGFRRVFKSLSAMWGTLRFRSGEGCLTMDGSGLDADRGEEAFVLGRPGFQVTICCRVSGERLPFPVV